MSNCIYFNNKVTLAVSEQKEGDLMHDPCTVCAYVKL